MKKFLSVLLCAACILSFAGCSNEPDPTISSQLQLFETSPTVDVEEKPSVVETVSLQDNAGEEPSPNNEEMELPVVELETIDVSSVLKAAYNNTFQLPLVHVTSARLWHNVSKVQEDAASQIDTSNRTYDIWFYNETGEAIWKEMRTYATSSTSSKNVYVLRQASSNDGDFGYKVYQDGADYYNGEYNVHPVRSEVGYESVLTPHWSRLIEFEDSYSLTTTMEGDYYVLTSKPLDTEELFSWSEGVCTITMYIHTKSLTFSTISVASTYLSESATFQFFINDCDNRFYTKDTQKALQSDVTGATFYATREEWQAEDELADITSYDAVKQIFANENINESESVEDGAI